MLITGLYAALVALLALLLAGRVMRRRWVTRTGLGSGGDETLARYQRAHGNLLEYAPLALILLLVLETDGTRPWLLHAFGATFVVARLLHAWGLSHSAGTSFGRGVGIGLSLLLILAMAGLLLYRHVLVFF